MQPDISDASLTAEIEGIDADFILCGHTHLPMVREIDGRTFVNPGSVGLPLDGDPHASYAVFHEGKIKLRRAKYDVEKTIKKLRQSTLPVDAAERLAEILRTGRNVSVTIPITQDEVGPRNDCNRTSDGMAARCLARLDTVIADVTSQAKVRKRSSDMIVATLLSLR